MRPTYALGRDQVAGERAAVFRREAQQSAAGPRRRRVRESCDQNQWHKTASTSPGKMVPDQRPAPQESVLLREDRARHTRSTKSGPSLWMPRPPEGYWGFPWSAAPGDWPRREGPDRERTRAGRRKHALQRNV